jgi:hypothetical protein
VTDLGIAVVSLLILVVIAIIAIPILIRIFGEAASRNPNRAGSEEDRARQERESGEQSRGSDT